VIASSAIQMNPAKWTIAFADRELELTSAEIQSMITLFNRLDVGGTLTGITHVSQVTIKSKVCGMNPANWTATYKKGE
jgi:hypothetical protein